MRSVRIKFCGIKRKEDVLKALELGVDYIGFILYPKSPRYVSWEKLKELLSISKGIKRVAVFVNPSYEEVKRAFDIGIDLVQLHGDESFDWNIAKSVVDAGFRVFLSGGLKPENVSSAIRMVRPYCVDVSSGIESSAGVKDHKKMEDFVRAVKLDLSEKFSKGVCYG